MGSGTSPELVSAVSNAGGLGALGCHGLRREQVDERTATIRRQTNKPFGLNFLLFHVREDSFAGVPPNI
jgi:NAD(P)H-dependent flavin oxidoreductase YrpB (nitropropane dioxygenase family)